MFTPFFPKLFNDPEKFTQKFGVNLRIRACSSQLASQKSPPCACCTQTEKGTGGQEEASAKRCTQARTEEKSKSVRSKSNGNKKIHDPLVVTSWV